ncbi:diaminopimelate decarboxylase [Streptoalloteichus tenebrarius]|uniref:Diaminopimelate decarboxylase n=1 Tax=Streptoalloteichus tenebrarius (strain ATCC 17920 / DSM 40477 / JCM 4838 / CBS 697.72 / NBRC 16177 / NCIMB 11028 / NRRL B-12390 / A12253. 1 / ISP 5477) TaxID=1933 RepID=A0ABT1HV75_STRSD|nr:diaminopimelate decarboxylase [Streptoalloteichus tenebrarius]MCP2259401.1 diaminopimelate decarboxylase [Streptoalloteichus tenebrarius]
MTLAEILPSLRGMAQARLEENVWPVGTTVDEHGELLVGGVRVTELAGRFGTPLHLIDLADVRRRCRAYRAALPGAEIAYASKAFLCRAMARLVAAEGLSLDVCSAGEIAVARSVGFPGWRMLLHGNAKTPEDLKAAFAHGVGRIVVDSLDEVEQLGALARDRQRVLVRVTPGVDGGTHVAVTTGVEDQKFGFPLSTGAAAEAVRHVLRQPNLRLVGLHTHLGSQLRRVADFELATRRLVGFLAAVRDEHGLELPELNLGGGHAVPQLPGEDTFDLAGFAHRVRVAVHDECARHRLRPPRLTVEPGRALVAAAGVTVYRVVAVKHAVRTFVAVDGGMSDNPRPALYGARYLARLVGRPPVAPTREVTVVGRHCEAGDVLARDVPLPGDVHAGDLLAVPATGAYHHSLASNYNLVGRPAVVAVDDGAVRLLVRRETEEDLLRRDVG